MDTSALSTKYAHSNTHSIGYELYQAKSTLLADYHRAKKNKRCELKTGACFAGLFREKNPSFNKVRYVAEKDPKMTEENKVNPMLTMDEVRAWIALNRRWKMLPRSVKFSSKKWEQQLIVDLEKQPVNMTYLYLSVFRYLREDSGFVRAFVKLVKEQKVNHYIAMVIVHRYCHTFSGHSILSEVRGYIEKPPTKDSTFDLKMARRLRLFVKDPWKYDKRSSMESQVGNPFNLQNTIGQIKVVPCKRSLKLRYAKDRAVVRYVTSDDMAYVEAAAKRIREKCV